MKRLQFIIALAFLLFSQQSFSATVQSDNGIAAVNSHGSMSSNELSIASLFKAMPDSLMPYLSKNNRLDMLDFRDANMKAEVTNLLDGKSEMTQLSADSLTIRMSDILDIEMSLVFSEPSDTLIHVVRIYHNGDTITERIRDVYNSHWQLLSSVIVHSSVLRRDDDVFADKP